MKALVGIILFAVVGVTGCSGSGQDAADPVVTETVTVPAEEESATADTESEGAGPEPTCAYSGTDPDFKDMLVDLTFTNSLGDVNGLEVTYALLDGEGGTRFFTGTAGGLDLEDISFPAANEQFQLSVETGENLARSIDEATIGCTVLAIEESTDIGGYQRATEADTCKVRGADSSGDIQVEVEVTSPYEETTTVQTWWALNAPGPVRFETETEVVALVGAGESIRIIPEYGTEKPKWIGTIRSAAPS